MKVLTRNEVAPEADSDVETLDVSAAQFSYLEKVAHEMNPDMPMAFGGGHVIRTLLERLEDSGIDLTDASSEQEVTQAAVRGLRRAFCDTKPDRAD